MKPSSNDPRVTCKKVIEGRWIVSCPGSPEVKIYETLHAKRGTTQFNVVYYAVGVRKVETRVTWETAKERAETVAKELAKGESAIAPISAQNRVVFERAATLLAPAGVGMDKAAILVSEALQKLQGRCSLPEAIDFVCKHVPAGGPSSQTVTEVKDLFVAARRSDGCGSRHLDDLETRLNRFCKDFQCVISSVTTPAISDWLRGLKKPDNKTPVNGRTRNNYRNALRNFFRYAVAQDLISGEQLDWDEDNGIALARETDEVIEIYSPKEISALIQAASFSMHADKLPKSFNKRYVHQPGLVPFLVLGAFAGLRSSEIVAQRWEDIDLERGYIRVTKAKGNTPSKRLVPIEENLKQWLALYRQESGPVCEYSRPEDPIRRLTRRCKLTWKHNALRHSCLSYQMALHHDAAKVSSWAGNSPGRVHKNYRELVRPEEAKTWFAIQPEAPANVTPMPAKVAA